mgnify:CR=1 FL=1
MQHKNALNKIAIDVRYMKQVKMYVNYGMVS